MQLKGFQPLLPQPQQHNSFSESSQIADFRFVKGKTFSLYRCKKQIDDLMESKGGKKKSSSSKSIFYEAPLGYSIEDIRPNGGIKKFRSAAYSNCARKPS
ncbi:conserved peptide upstream open reading frame 10 [Striga hermonthica]|uniref:Conserved peptide upstream open reading frame 10 n=1 Tax=Striga hermonthica TaxID=68872 RepID=A0A9N7NC65_STRHE|nr:conserved peptide upstream open reading frame 10 [Striga hermonthica]